MEKYTWSDIWFSQIEASGTALIFQSYIYSFLWYLYRDQALSWIIHLRFSCQNGTVIIPWRDVSLQEKPGEQKRVWSIVYEKKLIKITWNEVKSF